MWLSYHHFNLISNGWSSCPLKFHVCGEVDMVLYHCAIYTLTLYYQCTTRVARKVWGGQMAYGLVLESLVIFVMRLH